MLNNNNIYIFIFTILSFLLIFVLNYVQKRKNKKQFENVFTIILILLIFWVLCDILQITCAQRFNIDPIYFDYFAYIPGCFLSVAFFFMALIFAKTKITYKKGYLLLFIIPMLSLFLLWTNKFHNLFYIKYSTDLSKTIYGSYMNIHTSYTYGLFAISLYILIKYSIKNAGFFSKQAMLIFIGTLIPILTNILGGLKIIQMNVYITPITFVFTILCLTLAIFKFNMLKSTPIALQRIVDRISDSYVVLNENYEISDFNQTYVNTFKVKNPVKDRGINFLHILEKYNINSKDFYNRTEKIKGTEETDSLQLYIERLEKYFKVEITSIMINGQLLGILVLFKDVTQHHKDMETIKNNQDMLIERERLSSLGQMIGGIAHNLKTPIMSISGAAEAIKDLTLELDNSIGNPVVTEEDFHDIAKDYYSWIEKIKNYTEYMSDIITAVKGQAVNFSNDEEVDFTISELLKRVDILMKHELKNAIIYLRVSMQINEKTIIKGDINSLVQIVNNMISNAIQAYNGKTEETIELIVSKQNNNCVISIKDNAGGLPEKIQNRLFKEMVTTKGKNGTGLGLYMSYSTIKAHFNGDITFETETGKGTTFNIFLPL